MQKVVVAKKIKKSNKYVRISNDDVLYETEFDDKELSLIDINDNTYKGINNKLIVRISQKPEDLTVYI